ncbi:MAG: hypothetical protein HYS44_00400 [Candidatus Niyogibacteria bacterium]|nr:hypothetical protein [Candidatus Niyogibacteria bacterium]
MNRRIVIGAIGVVILAATAFWYLFASQQRAESIDDAIRAVTEAPAPSDVTPPDLTAGVPELNPLDKINPFNYVNPFD